MDSPIDEVRKENLAMREDLARLKDLVSILREQLAARECRPHATIKQRLRILRHMEFFKIPSRKAHEYFCIARSTIYRWRSQLDRVGKEHGQPANKTPVEIVRLVWEIFEKNPAWGKLRIAQQLALLRVFLAASTVRNILNRPRPPCSKTDARGAAKTTKKPKAQPIAARRPNEIWSADMTTVKTWGLRQTYVLGIIDHFSRRVVAMLPLKRPDGPSLTVAFQSAITSAQAPTRLITDDGSVFKSAEFLAFLKQSNVSYEIGALGQSDSIAVTERLFLTLKSEWLPRVVFIRGIDHLADLCTSFQQWVNDFRPHQRLGGACPSHVHESALAGQLARLPLPRTAKSVPLDIERLQFADTRTAAWRLPCAA